MTSLTLPDIAAQGNQQTLPLDWVGMCGIALPLLIEGRNVAAYADAGVSLDDGTSRGFICRGCTWRWRRSSNKR